MIIDFHAHVFPDKMAAETIAFLEEEADMKAALDGTVTKLIASMKEASVDLSVLVPVVTAPKQFDGINRFAHSINEQYDNLLSFGGIHPDCEDYREKLNQLLDMGFQGIKLHPDYQKVFFNDIRYKRLISYATELGMTIVVHAGVDIGLPNPVHCTPSMAKELLADTQSDKVVLAHLGGWKMWDEVEAQLVGSKAYLDISFIHRYIEMEQFYRIVDAHGAEKILFASDSPWASQQEMVEWLNNSRLSEETKEKIFWKNASQLLGK